MSLKVIRKYCLDCSNNQPNEITLCPGLTCFFYACRLGKNKTKPRISALKLIRKFCLDCSDSSYKSAKECTFKDCPLFKYRFGKNPNCKNRKGNPEALKKYHISH